MLDLTELDATPGDDALETAIQKRVRDLDSGKYKSNTEHVLRLFATWLREDQDVHHVSSITSQTLREWSRALSGAVEDEEDDRQGTDDETDTLAASTAEQYYAYVSAFMGWAVREEHLDTNPALTNKAKEPLPKGENDARTHFWSERERDAICATADQLVDESFDNEDERAQLRAYRNRALVYTLAFTGCRGAELAAVSDDSKRNGLRWTSVDLDLGTMSVFGKNREREQAPILEPAEEPLDRWRQVLDAPDSTWPVFPTLHLPSLYGALPDDVESSPETVWDDLREHDCAPPSISTSGVRSILKRLCKQSPYEFEETLKPHGARRGLGDTLYQERPGLAQDQLRHKSIRTTHEAYTELDMQRTKQQADEVLRSED